jgi:hypothetical protein
MRNTIFFTILQYNVRNDKVIIMISLLTDNNTQDYDVVVIQKSWQNLFASTTLSSHQCEFHLLYKLNEDTKVCFYVNDRIDIKDWKIEYSTTDICVLTLIIRVASVSKTIRIYNVYNFFSISYSFRDSLFTLSNANRNLFADNATHHLLLENFNLHHSFWSDSSRSIQHAAIDHLFNMMNKHDLWLILSKSIVTWKNLKHLQHHWFDVCV